MIKSHRQTLEEVNTDEDGEFKIVSSLQMFNTLSLGTILIKGEVGERGV